MTARDLYEYTLVELRKENAPNILLEDFNYFINKAINQYINKRYNIYDINQQTTDDLSVLKTSVYLTPTTTEGHEYPLELKSLKATATFVLPSNYLHILNCHCFFKVNKTWRCYDANDIFELGATRLTSDAWSNVVNNYWNKPTYRRPYYYIHNRNLALKDIDIIDGNIANISSTTSTPKSISESLTITNETNISFGDSYKDSSKTANTRYGNASRKFMEVRYGTDVETFTLVGVNVDYIMAPQFIRLTQKQIDKVQDESQILEFPDYVCQEILNELVHIIMENISDQRLQTHPVVSQSIANPAQQQTEPVAQQQPT